MLRGFVLRQTLKSGPQAKAGTAVAAMVARNLSTRTDPLYYRIQLVTYPSLIHVPLVSLVPTEPGICALFLKW